MKQYLHFAKNLASAGLGKTIARIHHVPAEAYDVTQETPVQSFYSGKLFDPLQLRFGLSPIAGIPPCGLPPHQIDLTAVGFPVPGASLTA